MQEGLFVLVQVPNGGNNRVQDRFPSGVSALSSKTALLTLKITLRGEKIFSVGVPSMVTLHGRLALQHLHGPQCVEIERKSECS